MDAGSQNEIEKKCLIKFESLQTNFGWTFGQLLKFILL
jgi:hypothetical protein